ncbi:hypothetical protein [Nitrosococcus wardiae]|uniref:Uncharacterized protein n=1 Tax=Nitrosococcus wardiae TaxID=1814290 RepID=A0A4P7BUQ8_9GAMM|nr:hypothetical protein [Nitrosococcus wardiae]QBQ53693.1 hypothetical protein E3U44_03590 [Nitrosococcus wardiae]
MAFFSKLAASVNKLKPSPGNSPLLYFRNFPAIILPLFSMSAAIIGFLVLTDNPLQNYLASPWAFGIGWGCLVLAAALYWLPQFHYSWSYDLFCTATLLIWFSSWQEVYRPGAPIFQSYPFYFVLLALLVTYTLVRNRDLNQAESANARLLRHIFSFPLLHPLIFFALTLWGVLQPEDYLTYPAAMGLLIIRYGLFECLHNRPIAYLQVSRKPILSPLFTNSIYPIMGQYGPLITLARISDSSPMAPKILRHKNAMSYWVTEEEWRQWLQSAVQHCFLVLLDLRQATQNAADELQNVCSQVAHHRILVLCDDAQELFIPADVSYFDATQLKDEQHFQTALERWFKQSLRPVYRKITIF